MAAMVAFRQELACSPARAPEAAVRPSEAPRWPGSPASGASPSVTSGGSTCCSVSACSRPGWSACASSSGGAA